MVRVSLSILLCIIGLVCSVAAEDIPGWGTLVDPLGDCPVDFTNKGIQLTVPPGVHQLNPVMERVTAPRIWNDVAGDFLFEARVIDFPRPELDTGANGNRSYIAAGLVLWQDEKSFLRWTRSASAEANAVYLSCEQFDNAKFVGGGNFKLDDQPIWLRIERRGNTLRMSASSNGNDWKQMIERQSNYQNALKVGVFGLNVTDKPLEYRFESPFLLRSQSPKPAN